MTQKRPLAPDFEKAAPQTVRNPYIVNFCKVLVEKKGEEHDPEALKKLIDDMYSLYENMLGRNMVNALPEDVRRQYKEMANDLQNLDYDKIGQVFDENIPNYEMIMKETLREFTQVFMQNRDMSVKEVIASHEQAAEPDTELSGNF